MALVAISFEDECFLNGKSIEITEYANNEQGLFTKKIILGK